ncbi:MAG: PorP/SprF family type IX secretion system membrane protein [Bacteroidota bacterium]
MKKFIGILIISFTIFLESASAQQYPLFSQYMFNRLIINPAYAGNSNIINGSLAYRQQLIGIDGAPETHIFSIHAPIQTKSMGIGLKVIHDKIVVTGQTSISAIYSYHLNFAKGKLSFGLEGGIFNQSIDFPNLRRTDQLDNALPLNKESIMTPDAAFGIYYHSDKFYLGVSLYHLLENKLNYTGYTENDRTLIAQLSRHSLLTGGYSINTGENIKIEPSFLVKYISSSPIQIDMNINAIYKNMLTIGGSYRTGDAIVFLLQYSFKDKIKLGYSYDYTISELASYNNGSHEIMFSYNIILEPGRKKIIEPIIEEIIASIDSLPEDLQTKDSLQEYIQAKSIPSPVEDTSIVTEAPSDTIFTDTISTDTVSEDLEVKSIPPDTSIVTETISDTILTVTIPTTDTLPEDLVIIEEEIQQDEEMIPEAEDEDEQIFKEEAGVEETKIIEEEITVPEEEIAKISPAVKETGSIKLEGVVTSNGAGIKDVSVKLFKEADVIKEIKTSETGGFSFEISQDGDYSLYITKEGYIDRFSDISTIPKDGEGVTYDFELERK